MLVPSHIRWGQGLGQGQGNIIVPAGRMLQQTPSCGALPQFPNGFFELVQGAVGARAAKFQCLPGFALVGSPIISCGSNGRGPSNLPSCQGKLL